jgi:hypothetical protein
VRCFFSSQLFGVVSRQLFLSVVTLVFPHFRVSSKVDLFLFFSS